MEYKREKVKGYEQYEVDTNGIVYSKRGKPLKYSINHKGYCMINLYVNHERKGFGIHTIVAKQFLTAEENRIQVNHKDGNKTNNNVDNLEWATPLENVQHSIEVLGKDNSRSKNHNAKKVYGYDIKTNELKYSFDCVIDAGMFFGNNDYTKARHIQNIISQIASNKNSHYKSYRGMIWKY